MTKLTKEQRIKYVKTDKGLICPYCGQHACLNVPDDYTGERNRITLRVDCDSCGKAWNDVYMLVKIEEQHGT